DLLEEIRFDVVHVAMYSPRPGTLSFKWEDDVPAEVKKQRLHAVEAVQERIARELNAPYEGQTVEVLVEQRQVGNGQSQWRGRSRTNKLVFFPATKPGATEAVSESAQGGAAVAVKAPAAVKVQPGDLVHVYIERTSPWSLQGYLATR